MKLIWQLDPNQYIIFAFSLTVLLKWKICPIKELLKKRSFTSIISFQTLNIIKPPMLLQHDKPARGGHTHIAHYMSFILAQTQKMDSI